MKNDNKLVYDVLDGGLYKKMLDAITNKGYSTKYVDMLEHHNNILNDGGYREQFYFDMLDYVKSVESKKQYYIDVQNGVITLDKQIEKNMNDKKRILDEQRKALESMNVIEQERAIMDNPELVCYSDDEAHERWLNDEDIDMNNINMKFAPYSADAAPDVIKKNTQYWKIKKLYDAGLSAEQIDEETEYGILYITAHLEDFELNGFACAESDYKPITQADLDLFNNGSMDDLLGVPASTGCNLRYFTETDYPFYYLTNTTPRENCSAIFTEDTYVTKSTKLTNKLDTKISKEADRRDIKVRKADGSWKTVTMLTTSFNAEGVDNMASNMVYNGSGNLMGDFVSYIGQAPIYDDKEEVVQMYKDIKELYYDVLTAAQKAFIDSYVYDGGKSYSKHQKRKFKDNIKDRVAQIMRPDVQEVHVIIHKNYMEMLTKPQKNFINKLINGEAVEKKKRTLENIVKRLNNAGIDLAL
jgi:hypothetical protein